MKELANLYNRELFVLCSWENFQVLAEGKERKEILIIFIYISRILSYDEAHYPFLFDNLTLFPLNEFSFELSTLHNSLMLHSLQEFTEYVIETDDNQLPGLFGSSTTCDYISLSSHFYEHQFLLRRKHFIRANRNFLWQRPFEATTTKLSEMNDMNGKCFGNKTASETQCRKFLHMAAKKRNDKQTSVLQRKIMTLCPALNPSKH